MVNPVFNVSIIMIAPQLEVLVVVSWDTTSIVTQFLRWLRVRVGAWAWVLSKHRFLIASELTEIEKGKVTWKTQKKPSLTHTTHPYYTTSIFLEKLRFVSAIEFSSTVWHWQCDLQFTSIGQKSLNFPHSGSVSTVIPWNTRPLQQRNWRRKAEAH